MTIFYVVGLNDCSLIMPPDLDESQVLKEVIGKTLRVSRKADAIGPSLDTRYRTSLVILPTILLLALLSVPAKASVACTTTSSIASDFNGTSISGSNFTWFNSVIKLGSAVPAGGQTITFTSQSIVLKVPSGPNMGTITLTVPDSEVIFSASATTATTTFTGGMWVTTVPATFGDNIFLSGLSYLIPAGGLPSGVSPVTWKGTFGSSAPFSLQWQWGAAVYTTFSTNYNSLGVKPAHSTTIDAYHNGDQAGTPENFAADVTGGARGGGGSNLTGSLSATGCAVFVIPEYPLIGTLLAALIPLASLAFYVKIRGYGFK